MINAVSYVVLRLLECVTGFDKLGFSSYVFSSANESQRQVTKFWSFSPYFSTNSEICWAAYC